MGNEELLNNLNPETRKYFDDVFSYLEYFLLNDDTRSKGSLIKVNDGDYLAYSFLLATIKDDKILQDVFAKHKIDLKTLEEFLNISNVTHIKAENSSYVKSNNLLNLFSEISERLKYNNYLEDTNINLSELKPYQIFDYMLETYYETYRDFCEQMGIDIEKDLALDLCKRVYDNDSDFAKKHGVDIDEECEKELEDSIRYDFDTFTISFDKDTTFISFHNLDEGTILKGIYNGEKKTDDELNKTIEVGRFYELKEFYGFKDLELTRENIDRVINNNDSLEPEFTIAFDTFDNNSYKVIFNKHQLFRKKPLTIEEENKLTLNEIMKTVKGESENKEYTPYLDKYGFDLTKDTYLKDPAVGRDDKLRELEKILLYPEKDKSILVTGIAGCGKTALIKGLAYRIQQGDVPEDLKNLHVISIDCASLVAGTKYVGTLEEKMKNLLDEASTSKDIVLFMDEIHQALGAGVSEGDSNSVSEILKPYLDYGRVRVIGSTTTEEYNEFVSKDDAFKTRFKRINISEPDDHIVYQILADLIESYNRLSERPDFNCPKLNLSIEEKDMIIKWLIDSTQAKYRTYDDRTSNPRLVLDIIKEAYAIAAINDKDEVTMSDLKEALLLEERLYLSSRKKQVAHLDEIKPTYNKDNVIPFNLVFKK